MPLPLSFYALTIADNTLKGNGQPETTRWELPVTTLTPSNVAAQETLMGNLQTAVAAITIGQFIKNETVYARNIIGAGIASSTLAQRENKWLIRYHDAVNQQKFQVSIGTADLTLLVSGEEFLVISGGPGGDLKTAFEAVIVSPNDSSHAVVVDSVQFVGRNT